MAIVIFYFPLFVRAALPRQAVLCTRLHKKLLSLGNFRQRLFSDSASRRSLALPPLQLDRVVFFYFATEKQ
jgi:hypothetical protein